MDVQEISFFWKMPSVIPLYETLRAMLMSRWPNTAITVQKSQIAFRQNGHPYCRVWLPTFKRLKGISGDALMITLGFRYPLNNSRVAAMAEPYPNRWTIHIPIHTLNDVDEELLDFIKESHAIAQTLR